MSEIRVTTLKDTSGGNSSTTADIFSGRAKAWVNFNGQGAVAARSSFNVNSITDNGTGDYIVNFSSALAAANYVVAGSTRIDTGDANQDFAVIGIRRTTAAISTGSCRVLSNNGFANGPSLDCDTVGVSFFR